MAASTGAAGLKAHPAVRNINGGALNVTGEAKEAFFASGQQQSIDASVRRVACSATFHTNGSMFKDPGAAFLHVAADAAFPFGFTQ